MPHSIPQLGGQLPLVQQARCLPVQDKRSVQVNHPEIVLLLRRVRKIHLAPCVTLRRGSLATPLRPFDDNRSGSTQPPIQQSIRNPISIIFCFHNHSFQHHKDSDFFPTAAFDRNSLRYLADFYCGVWPKFITAFSHLPPLRPSPSPAFSPPPPITNRTCDILHYFRILCIIKYSYRAYQQGHASYGT